MLLLIYISQQKKNESNWFWQNDEIIFLLKNWNLKQWLI